MPDPAPGNATPLPRRLPSPAAERRLRRLRGLSWLLDRSIPLGGNLRIGLDPLLGLLPGAGDWLGALASFYILYEGARLGLPVRVLARMAGNVLLETLVGAVPLLGDLFDFVWQANTRNLQLVERHYRAELEGRPLGRIWFALAAFAAVVLSLLAALFFAAFKAFARLLN